MSIELSQIVNIFIDFSKVFQYVNKENIQTLYYWSFVRGIHRSLVDPLTKGQECWKHFNVLKIDTLQFCTQGMKWSFLSNQN